MAETTNPPGTIAEVSLENLVQRDGSRLAERDRSSST
jgi:hypothetical protein